MRLLLTTDTRGGGWTHTLELARGLSRMDVDVTVAALGKRLPPPSRAALAATGANIYEAPFGLDWMLAPWAELADANRWLLRIYERVEPDVVQLNGTSHAAMRLPGPLVAVGHGCARTWWWSVMAGPPPVEWRRGEEILAAGLRRADAVVCASEAMSAMMRRCYGPLRRMQVIRPGRCGRRLKPGIKSTSVLSTGQLWDEGNNLQALDDAAGHIRWPVRVAGERRDLDGSTWRMRSVVTLGELDEAEMAAQMRRAAIFALPSRYAPVGMATLEAALSGCALVLGDIPALRETWGEAAVYVPADDSAALAEAVNELIEDDGARRRLSAAARQRGLAMTPQQTVRGFMRLYEQLRRESATQCRYGQQDRSAMALEGLMLRPRWAEGVTSLE
ncbi:MAG: glycosyltransferase family 4 protein [Phycisphaeraceae bacterium]